MTILTLLSSLLLLLLLTTALLILGNLKIIPWPDNLNTVFITILLPDLGVILALAQWLYSVSSEKEKGQRHPQEQTLHPSVSIPPVAPQSPLSPSGTPDSEQGKSASMSITSQDEGEQIDMGEAPHVEHFYGRVSELETVKRWIVDEHARLVSIIGVGGIGKTSLVAKLIDQERSVFQAVFWRSLLNAPPLERILRECLQFLTRTQPIEIPPDPEVQMRLLVAQLRKRRCLLVLDNAETVLKSGSSTGEYKDGYEGYGKLIHLLGESRHQSCLVVTSREQPKEITWLAGEGTSVYTYRLKGLEVDDARVILQRKGLLGEESSWKVLVLRDHTEEVNTVAFSPSGQTFASGCVDRTVRLWEVDSGQVQQTLDGHTGIVISVAFSPDGKTLVSGSADRTVRLWETNSGRMLKTLDNQTGGVSPLVFSPNGKLFASSSVDQTIQVCETNTGKVLRILQGHTKDIRSLVFSSDSKLLASGSSDQTVRLWEVGSGKLLTTLQTDLGIVWSLAFSPDSKLLASGSFEQAVQLWETSRGKLLHTLRSDRPYEWMNITQAKGLTESQKTALRLLGAIEDEA